MSPGPHALLFRAEILFSRCCRQRRRCSFPVESSASSILMKATGWSCRCSTFAAIVRRRTLPAPRPARSMVIPDQLNGCTSTVWVACRKMTYFRCSANVNKPPGCVSERKECQTAIIIMPLMCCCSTSRLSLLSLSSRTYYRVAVQSSLCIRFFAAPWHAAAATTYTRTQNTYSPNALFVLTGDRILRTI